MGLWKTSTNCQEIWHELQITTYHGSIGDEANKSVLGKQTQANHDCVTHRLETNIVLAQVDDEQKDRWCRRRSPQSVFDSGVFGEKFCRKIGVGDILVVWRERVSRQAEGADPKLSADVDLAAAGSAYQQAVEYVCPYQ